MELRSANDLAVLSIGRDSYTILLSAGHRASEKGYTYKSARKGSPDLRWTAATEAAPGGHIMASIQHHRGLHPGHLPGAVGEPGHLLIRPHDQEIEVAPVVGRARSERWAG